MHFLLAFLLAVVIACDVAGQGSGASTDSSIAVVFQGGYGSIEVGGPYAGFESHHSRPLPSRVSFFAPVANSMDLSLDYKRRDESQVLFVALQIDDGPCRPIGWEPWPYVLSPASVSFSKRLDHTEMKISYSFFKNSPGMMARLVVRNRDVLPHTYRLYTRWQTSLRTCQSYKVKNPARTWFDSSSQTIFSSYKDSEVANVVLLIGNGAAPPSAWMTLPTISTQSSDDRINSFGNFNHEAFFEQQADSTKDQPAVRFLYEKNLVPSDSLVIAQLLATTTEPEAASLAAHLSANFRDEIAAYEKNIADAAYAAPKFYSGNAALDESAHWAKAMLAANRHFIDGEIVPMPCPAEYNFYFTHDALMTDLAAANFDAKRVRNDLQYLARKASQEHLIPHAYYWKDDGFKTEFAGENNWNHFWLILVAASYLRHTGDVDFLRELQPILQKSLSLTLSHVGDDGLLWAEYPDWWDIGKAKGPRAYMTALAIRALHEFSFIAAQLHDAPEKLQNYAAQANSLSATLSQKLWDEKLNYLINFNHGTIKDEHIYAGSLLAAVFDELPKERQRQLVATAQQRLYDPRLGLRTADPRDFHMLENEFRFVNHEQGGQGEYLNGGVWPHCTAWYALALQQIGKPDEALEVVLNNMALTGVTNSPQGQPAMYEYRFSEPTSADYGRIDKPNFLWAGGWYLFTLYRLLGAAESPWNLHVLTDLPEQIPTPEFQWLINGKMADIAFSGNGKFAASIEYDGHPYPSLVIPLGRVAEAIKIRRGAISEPYLENLTASLIDASWTEQHKTLRWQSRAFPGHDVSAIVFSAHAPQNVLVDQKILPAAAWSAQREDKNSYRTVINYSHVSSGCEVRVEF